MPQFVSTMSERIPLWGYSSFKMYQKLLPVCFVNYLFFDTLFFTLPKILGGSSPLCPSPCYGPVIQHVKVLSTDIRESNRWKLKVKCSLHFASRPGLGLLLFGANCSVACHYRCSIRLITVPKGGIQLTPVAFCAQPRAPVPKFPME